MGGEWPVKTVAECASPAPYSTQIGPFGKALMAHEYVESGVPVLRGVNVNRGRFHDDDFVFINDNTANRLSKFESYPGDVLLVHKGTLGRIGLMPTKRKYHRYIMGNSMMRVRCDPAKLLPEYLYYWLLSADGQHYLFSRVSQVGVPQLQTPLTTLRLAKLPVPPLSEQRAITHTLGILDDKVELNLRRNETLERIAQAIFVSWFVAFDPVRAKAEHRQPVGMDPATAALFPDSFEDSPLGEIPRGWGVGTARELLSLGRDVIDPGEFPLEVFDHYSIPAFDDSRMPHVEQGGQIKSNKFVLPPSCVLLSKLNPRIPRVWLPTPRRERRAVCSTEFLVALPRPSVPVEFLYCLLGSLSFLDAFATLVTGTSGSHQRVSPEDLFATVALLPPPETTTRFAEAVRPMLQSIAGHLVESQTLAGLRDTLLPKLLSAEIRVKDAQKFVGAAT